MNIGDRVEITQAFMKYNGFIIPDAYYQCMPGEDWRIHSIEADHVVLREYRIESPDYSKYDMKCPIALATEMREAYLDKARNK